jgi:hypothetical protein
LTLFRQWLKPTGYRKTKPTEGAKEIVKGYEFSAFSALGTLAAGRFKVWQDKDRIFTL